MTLSPTECYDRNLTALRALQPDVARVVQNTHIPEGITSATGRDGSKTFLIRSDTGAPAWFGGSSMPSISSAEVFAGFSSDGHNVSLPGVFTGAEPLAVASKMPPHTALFVVEGDPLQLKLAMHLHDYVGLLGSGRLVFILAGAEGLDERLRAFFEHHPGYELPTQLLTTPHRSAAQIAEVQGGLENAGKLVTAVQARVVEAQVRTIQNRTLGPLPASPRVAVLGTDPSPASLEQARRIGRALTELEWPHRLCVPGAPDRCHVSARLQAILDADADLILFVNRIAGSIRKLLPGELPFASWLLPGTTIRQSTAREPHEHEVIFVSSRAQRDELAEAGVPEAAIEWCSPGADDTVYQPTASTSDDPDSTHAHVAVLMDLPDDRAEACNVTLVSHMALWEALKVAVRRSIDQYHDDMLHELIEAAQRDSGATLQDPKLREQFANLVQTRIAPATIARAAAETLAAKGQHVAVWGRNWPSFENSTVTRHTAIPAGDALNRIFNNANVVLLPVSDPWAVQTALDALAAGTRVICRQPGKPLGEKYPGLADVAPYLPSYQTSRQLLNLVSKLTSSRNELSDPYDTARTLVRKNHTIASRLRSIVEALRRRQIDSAPDDHQITSQTRQPNA